MFELRWNPVIKWWVMVSSSRQNRPLLPKDSCPFCPGSPKVPEKYSVMIYPNDFPILALNPEKPTSKNKKLYKVARSYGKCEVVLYSSQHEQSFSSMPEKQLIKVIELWTERYRELGREKHIKYVFIFENKGEVVGVTIHHPHGQIYGYPFIPKKIQAELNSCRAYFKKNKRCLYCDIMEEEIKDSRRMVCENESFVAFVPFFAEYPYQVFVLLREHKLSLDELNRKEKEDLAEILKRITKAYDRLFNMPFPYMMCFHQKPTDGKSYEYYHFHIEFYPPMRNEKTQKFNASSETGAWVHGNPTCPEEKAKELKEEIERG